MCQQRIYDLMKANPHKKYGAKELATLFDINTTTANRNLARMMKYDKEIRLYIDPKQQGRYLYYFDEKMLET